MGPAWTGAGLACSLISDFCSVFTLGTTSVGFQLEITSKHASGVVGWVAYGL